MDSVSPPIHHSLIRNVLTLQAKLLLGAGRDLVLSPLSLGAALLDFALSKNQPPRYFREVLQLGERSDQWIDLWSGAHEASAPQHENVDALLARVEDVIRDPKSGAHHARVLKRWAGRQVRHARTRTTAPSQDVSNPEHHEDP